MANQKEYCGQCNYPYDARKGKYALYMYCDNCGHFVHELYTDRCCLNPNIALFNKPTVNGNPSIREVCLNCGKTSSAKKINTVSDVKSLPTITDEKIDRLRNAFYDELKRFHEWAKKQNHSQFLEDHAEYLKSTQWKELRAKVLKRDNDLCQSCLIRSATQVHHLTYDRWRHEAAFDLVSVCDPCHKSIHSDKSGF